MMVVNSNGICAVRLKEEDIELVRKWRNSPYNIQQMNYQKLITKEEHEDWFHKINNDYNFYFIIQYQGKNTGVANIKNIDWDKKTGEVGIFVSDQKLIGVSTNLLVAITMCNFGFRVLGMDWMTSVVRNNNLRAKRFNLGLGFKMDDTQRDINSQTYHLTKEAFYQSTKKYFNFWSPLVQDNGGITIGFNGSDYSSGIANQMKLLCKQKSDVFFTGQENYTVQSGSFNLLPVY